MISVRLLQPDDDFSPATPGAWNAEALRIDFALDTLFDAMAGGDAFVREVAKTVVLSSVSTDLEVVRYRQAVVADALRRPQVVRDLYVLATEAVAEARKIYLGTLSHYPIWVLKHGRELMGVLLPSLARLRKTTERNAKAFPSAGWSHFFTRMLEQLGGGYLEEAQQRVAESVLPGGFLLSAGFGAGAKPDGFIVHLAPQTTFGWWERLRTYIFGPRLPPFAFAIHPRDESSARALEALRDRALADVARTLANSAEHVKDFFDQLRFELAFLIGCINLSEALAAKGRKLCIPEAWSAEAGRLDAQGLYDPTLALSIAGPVVANDLAADGKPLIVVTGANQGGKTTFLRSLGLGQLMMQAGMPVAAELWSASVGSGVFPHYKRQEDTAMESGKLDEELARMNDIVDRLQPSSVVLLNESFAATNEQEGSEIAGQIVEALVARKVRVWCVTHLHEFASGLAAANHGEAVFLRAERRDDGSRSFRLVEAPPLSTSFGADLYTEVFGVPPEPEPAASPARRNGARRVRTPSPSSDGAQRL